MTCKRVTYRKRKDAERALQRVIAARKRHAATTGIPEPESSEKHAYRCVRCAAWHLTSGPVNPSS